MPSNITVGQYLIRCLERLGVEVVFGIPGVHTIELYRGLAASSICHITPRHEQSAGFMADGYYRASGKIAAAFVISGPGLTNCLTAMAQARADSIPMLVVSGVNETETLGKGHGHLHELPNQQALIETMGIVSEHVGSASELLPALQRIKLAFATQRPAPIHLQIPLDVMVQTCADVPLRLPLKKIKAPSVNEAIKAIDAAQRIVIIAGGGSIAAAHDVQVLAERCDAPAVLTINARGLLADHDLSIPASPSLSCVRDLIREADLAIVVGSELGPTDFDIYNQGLVVGLPRTVRIDIDTAKVAQSDDDIYLYGPAEQLIPKMALDVAQRRPSAAWGASKAREVRMAARQCLPPAYLGLVEIVEAIRDVLPNSIIVGDSTQAIYAANMVYGHDSPRGWFNCSVGYGALGYAIPAAIGAAIAESKRPVICVVGDGGAQFSLAELKVAVEEKLPVLFLVWNNAAYQEIATAMQEADVEVLGCHPAPPDFYHLAQAMGLSYRCVKAHADPICVALTGCAAAKQGGPHLIEVNAKL